MIDILFITDAIPISSNSIGGASALIYSHLFLLLEADFKVHVLILSENEKSEELSLCINSIKKLSTNHNLLSWSVFELKKPLPGEARVSAYLQNPMFLFFPNIINKTNLANLTKIISQLDPYIIWAEHFPAACLAAQIERRRTVYSHHDWLWKLQEIKNKQKNLTPRKRIRAILFHFLEEQITGKMFACITGSMVDYWQIRKLGVKNVGYFPTAYSGFNVKLDGGEMSTPRIVHLGGMNATANRLGLERFMQVVWPRLVSKLGYLPELWIIGDMTNATPNLLQLLKSANAICTGFVEDLSNVLRPYDIHIIPWEYSTGTRTRLPVIFAFGQALIAVSESVACYHEIVNGKNCILVSKLSDMSGAILNLLNNGKYRREIGIFARKTFDDSFTFDAQNKPFTRFINSIIRATYNG